MTPKYLDDETLTSNLDDDLATRIYAFLENVERVEPDRLEFWVHIMKLWNETCQNKTGLELFEKILPILEERYVQTKS